MKVTAREFVHQILYLTDSLIKVRILRCKTVQWCLIALLFFLSHYFLSLFLQFVHLEKAKDMTIENTNQFINKIHTTYDDVTIYTNNALVSISQSFTLLNMIRSSSTSSNIQFGITFNEQTFLTNVLPFIYELLYQLTCMQTFLLRELIMKKYMEVPNFMLH